MAKTSTSTAGDGIDDIVSRTPDSLLAGSISQTQAVRDDSAAAVQARAEAKKVHNQVKALVGTMRATAALTRGFRALAAAGDEYNVAALQDVKLDPVALQTFFADLEAAAAKLGL